VKLAVAVVGAPVPDWLAQVPAAEPALIDARAVEAGLNGLLEQTSAPMLVAVQADDAIDPQGLLAVARVLATASPAVAGATGSSIHLSFDDGAARGVAPVHLQAPGGMPGRLPHPVLLRTEALRAAGGWRPGEAGWPDRSRRHRHLLARLLAAGRRIIAVHALLGRMAPFAASAEPSLAGVLQQLLYQTVTVQAGTRTLTGRVAALTAEMLTLAGPDGQVHLLPVARLNSVRPGAPAPPAPPDSWP
jgi:hypothetical protein